MPHQNPLTPAETQVLDLLCEGFGPKEVARLRKTTVGTAATQIKALNEKTGLTTLKLVVRELRHRGGLPPAQGLTA